MFAFNSSVIPPVGARFFGSTYQGGISLVDDTLAIGAWGTNASRGSTHIFRRNLAFDWALEANLMPEEEGASFFGISVAMSYLPGQTRLQLAVGSPNDQAACAGNQYCGAVELYERSTDGAWLHRTRLVDAPSPQSAHMFGWFVALRGSTLVVGSYGYETYTGRVHIFSVGGAFSDQPVRQAVLTASDAATQSNFGWSASIAASEERILVGSPRAYGVKGSVYLFERTSGLTDWSEVAKMRDADGHAGDRFGTSNAFVEGALGAERLMCGSKHKSLHGFQHNGGAFLYASTVESGSSLGEGYVSGASNWSAVALVVPPGADGALNGGVIAAHSGRVVLAPYGAGCNPMPGETCATQPDQGKVYLYRCTHNCMLSQTILPPAHAAADAVADRFGAAVALDQDWLAVAAPLASTGLPDTTGVVYLYQWDPEARPGASPPQSPPQRTSYDFLPPSSLPSPSLPADVPAASAASFPGWTLYVVIATVTIGLVLAGVVSVARARGTSVVAWVSLVRTTSVRPGSEARESHTASPRAPRGRKPQGETSARIELDGKYNDQVQVSATSVVYSM